MVEISGLRFGYPVGRLPARLRGAGNRPPRSGGGRERSGRSGDGGFGLSVPALKIVRGEKIALVGPSGSGKTTLVYLMTGILRPDSGRILVDEQELTGRTDQELRDLRITKVGFIFQEFELLEYLNVKENILLPYLVNRSLTLDADVRERAETLARGVGLGAKLGRRPDELSHGERQRVAICRALVTQPSLIIADEPTGNLDRTTADAILALIVKQAERQDATLVVVTHDQSLLEAFDRVVDLRDYATMGEKRP